jgi:hypothetical protein
MKNQILAVIFGILLSFTHVTFAQTGVNYKQQFSKSESVKQPCSNLTISNSIDPNYKQSAKANSVSSFEFASIAKCCNKCNDASCCKENKLCNEKNCCVESNISADYKHSPFLKNDYKMGGCKSDCCS